MASTSTSTARKGVSLAKGPIGILGIAGIVYGILALIFGGNSFALHIPHGFVGDGHLFGLRTNGWTDLLFVAAGLFLLLGAPAHRVAKSAALIVALVLGAAAVIAVIRGNGVFGIFAANGWTEIIWGAAAIVLALLTTLPRVGARDGGSAGTRTSTSATGDPSDPSDPRGSGSGSSPLVGSR